MSDAIAGFVEARGDEAAAAAALAAIAADPAAAARLADLLAIDEALSARWSPDRADFVARLLARARRGRAPRAAWAAAAVVAAVAAALVVALAGREVSAPLTVIARAGSLRDGVALAADAAVAVGEEIAAPPVGDAALRWSDGTTLLLDAGARVDLVQLGDRARALALREGAISAAVAHLAPGDRFTIATAQAEVRIIGTRLRVAADAQATEVAVDEGVVSVVDLGTGGEARVVAGGRLRIAAAATREVDDGAHAAAWLTGPALAARDTDDGAGAACVRFAWDFAPAPGSWPAWALRPLAPAQDWRGWTGVRVRLRGRGDGRHCAIEILDDLPAADEGDPLRHALRFSRELVDDAVGWRIVELPFATLTRHPTQPPEAAEHALRLDHVVGIAFDPWPGAGDLGLGGIELYRR